MIKDRFIGHYIGLVKEEIEAQRDALASASFVDLAQVTRIQGNIDGLNKALTLLEATLEENDV